MNKVVTDRDKIEMVCELAGCNVQRRKKTTIIDNRRFHFDDDGTLAKIQEYTEDGKLKTLGMA